MHWMRPHVFLLGNRSSIASLTVVLFTALAGQAQADLIRPNPDRAYPDVAADVNGVVSYGFNPSTGLGDFHLTNTPFLLAGGPTPDLEFSIIPNADGIRRQIVNVALDSSGHFVSDPGNFYQLYGTVTAGGHTYSGLLLEGIPTAFGWQYRGPTGSQGSAIFDMNINVTGGQLKSAFGPDVYMSIEPELQITFDGNFNKTFTAAKATSNTRAYHSPLPFPSPEPTTLAILLSGGVFGLLARRKFRQLKLS